MRVFLHFVRLSVRPSVCHIHILCLNGLIYHHPIVCCKTKNKIEKLDITAVAV